jgi:hypothetical protein
LDVLLNSQVAMHELLTSNAQVPYVFTFLDLSKGLKLRSKTAFYGP